MKGKGLINKIYRVNPNSVLCNMADFEALKEGKTITLKTEEAEQLLSLGVVGKIKSSKKGSK